MHKASCKNGRGTATTAANKHSTIIAPALSPCIHTEPTISPKTLVALTATPALALEGDWELACDNSGYCAAAGYQTPAQSDHPVSLRISRPAGADSNIDATIRFQEDDVPAQLELCIDDKKHGTLNSRDEQPIAATQRDALIAALLADSHDIRFHAADGRNWQLSAAGARATLQQMDTFQQRSDTPSALVAPGNSHAAVLAPEPYPVIKPVIPSQEAARRVAADDTDYLVLRARFHPYYDPTGASIQCDKNNQIAAFTLYPLDDEHYLSERACWQGQYNHGNLYGLISRDLKTLHKTYPRELNDYDPATGELSGSGLCRGFTGNAWPMTTWDTTEVEDTNP